MNTNQDKEVIGIKDIMIQGPYAEAINIVLKR